MKQVLFGSIVGAALLLGTSAAASEEMGRSPQEEILEQKKIRSFEELYLKNQIGDLQRRLARLEDEVRFLEDQTRNLDRRVDDLRSRHT